MSKSANAPAVDFARNTQLDSESGNFVRSLLALLDRAGIELETDAQRARISLRRAASILQCELERHSDAGRLSKPGDLAGWQVCRVTAYIDKHLSERIYIEDLARLVRLSKSYFCRAFKCTMGETPHGFIARQRLETAERMMLTGDAPLSEIALCCGFADQAHFSNCFRGVKGQSPAAWRRQRRERDAAAGDLSISARGTFNNRFGRPAAILPIESRI